MRTSPARIYVSAMKLTILLLALIAPFHVQAAERPAGVVELFTSQGCSSCPPADALLMELAERDDVVALAYHVDYWDYLGWKDELATPENTARQRAYGETFDRSVYTPQAVVNGQRDIVGSHRKDVYAAIDEGSESVAALRVDVDISSNDGSVFVDVGAAKAAPADAHIVVVYYQPRQVVSIRGGENRGRSIDYRNIVTSFQTVGMWHGKAMRLELPKSEMKKKGGRCAVLLQSFDAEGRPGAILGAARTAESW
ncbi:DUF1223 domain-containing protein [Chelativorans xinjiangense]|uniref:DUF1223 domain-containing protein n=1 Tax=Chelativorans xinjiangense TaxID=2681485 RepID=UPI00135AB77F|nr:DUF1223 domain-containing protein [Chelativorans xinjiangense]